MWRELAVAAKYSGIRDTVVLGDGLKLTLVLLQKKQKKEKTHRDQLLRVTWQGSYSPSLICVLFFSFFAPPPVTLGFPIPRIIHMYHNRQNATEYKSSKTQHTFTYFQVFGGMFGDGSECERCVGIEPSFIGGVSHN